VCGGDVGCDERFGCGKEREREDDITREIDIPFIDGDLPGHDLLSFHAGA